MPQDPSTPARSRLVSRAWISVVLIPVAVAIALIVGFALTGLLEPSTGAAPLWQDLVVGLVALALIAIPCLAAIGFARQAQALGDPGGRLPGAVATITLVAAAILVVGSVLYNAVS